MPFEPPPFPEVKASQRKRRVAIGGVWIGAILTLGPVWGTLGTIIGMTRTFDTIARSGRTAGEVAGGISESLVSTTVGILVFPIGAVVLIFSILALRRLNRERDGANQRVESNAGYARRNPGGSLST